MEVFILYMKFLRMKKFVCGIRDFEAGEGESE